MTEPYYSDDHVTIYHGDTLDLFHLIPSGSIDLVVTDPPYIIGAVSAGSMASKSGGWADMMNSSTWFTAWYREAKRTLRSYGAMWTFLNWRTMPVVMRSAIDSQMPITSLAVWDKEWIGPGGPQGLRPSHEMFALLAMPQFKIPDRGVADVWRHKVGSFKASGHPAEKPEKLIRRIITTSALDGIVLDPFMGSGTTLVAAKNAGNKSIGFEAEERYCEIAARRCAQEVLAI